MCVCVCAERNLFSFADYSLVVVFFNLKIDFVVVHCIRRSCRWEWDKRRKKEQKNLVKFSIFSNEKNSGKKIFGFFFVRWTDLKHVKHFQYRFYRYYRLSIIFIWKGIISQKNFIYTHRKISKMISFSLQNDITNEMMKFKLNFMQKISLLLLLVLLLIDKMFFLFNNHNLIREKLYWIFLGFHFCQSNDDDGKQNTNRKELHFSFETNSMMMMMIRLCCCCCQWWWSSINQNS